MTPGEWAKRLCRVGDGCDCSGCLLSYCKIVRQIVQEERARCVRIARKWENTGHLKLHAGEMTAQEARTAIAVVKAIAAAIEAGEEG